MKFLVVVAAAVAAVSALPTNPGFVLPAGNIGLSGITRTDGTIEGFTGDFTRDIVAIGHSGIVTRSGNNVQLDRNLHRVRRAYYGFTRPEGSVGLSGIVRTDGTIDAFPGDFTHDIVAIGDSGIVTKSGKNVQLDRNLHRVRRAYYGFTRPEGSVGLSGIVRTDGTIDAFPGDFTHDIVAIGDSGIVTKSGKNVQLDRNLHRVRRAYYGFTRPEGSVGLSGIVRTDGTIDAFPGDFTHDIVAIGDSGIVTKSGKNVQLDRNLHRVRRAYYGFTRPEGSVGLSGIVRTDGTIDAFPGDFTHDIVAIGDSGIVTKSGKNVQLTTGLHRV
nr:uncharacterized protein LOC128694578 [Cherax quadricarinatus]